ncbi:MAG: DNA polymerase III subunit gamma/tau [Woeseiaceae bacterium]|nr:DNA polymerase III subunit gamma/tau [Woeseiaceae bacterium]
MSYLALARKWRPKTFADTVGQEHVLKALVNALDSGRLHHAYLFTGTRGVGKTTIARILAKSLNCEEGVSSEPCGVCSACLEIDEGRFVDLIEVDAASKTKVDDTRELLDNVQYAPTRGRYKVYLIDEVHMLSASSFNALLKTLEEPPPHVKFLLATTDPQRVPVTVLSRCLQFNLQRLTSELIAARLNFICDEESIQAEAPALTLLSRAADGSLRDALSLLDQAIAYSAANVDEASVATMLGTIDRNYVVKILRALAANDPNAMMDTVADIDQQFPNYARLLEDLARALQQIAVFQAVGRVDSESSLGDDLLGELSGLLSPGDVQLFYQAALMGRRDIDLAPDGRSGAEMTLLRMLAFRPASEGSSVPPQPKPKSAAKAAPQPKPVETKAEGTTTTEKQPASGTAAAWGDPDWSTLHTQIGLTGLVRILASNCALLKRQGSTVFLSLDARSESYLTGERKKKIAEALSKHFGETLTVDITVGVEAAETPVQAETRMQDEKLEQARQSLESDPNVQSLKTMFNAEIKTETITPIGDSERSK